MTHAAFNETPKNFPTLLEMSKFISSDHFADWANKQKLLYRDIIVTCKGKLTLKEIMNFLDFPERVSLENWVKICLILSAAYKQDCNFFLQLDDASYQKLLGKLANHNGDFVGMSKPAAVAKALAA